MEYVCIRTNQGCDVEWLRGVAKSLRGARGQSDMLGYLCRTSSALLRRVRLHLLGTFFGGQVLPLHRRRNGRPCEGGAVHTGPALRLGASV